MRGYFLERREDPGVVHYYCQNCGASHSIWGLIQLRFPELTSQYRLDRFRPAVSYDRAPKEDDLSQFNSRLPTKESSTEDELSWISVLELPEEHPVRRYLKRRGVESLSEFFFTSSFRQLANEISHSPPFSPAAMFYDHSRIVTRVTRDGVLQGIVGRAISSKDNPRYLIIKKLEEASMVYGYDQVDLDQPVFIAEGVFDSEILSNSVGLLGLSKREDVLHIPNRVWCLDNQPRSYDVVKNYRSLIEQGESVVLWDCLPPSLQKFKDLSSMFTDGKATKEFLDNYVRSSVVSGQAALLQLSRWAKVECRVKSTPTRASTIDAFKQKMKGS